MAKRKRTLEGFGPVRGLSECLKQIGTIGGTKGIRPVGGSDQGVTGVTRGNVGDVKLKPIGGKGVAGGRGPKLMPDATTGVQLKTHEGMGKSGLPKKCVRSQP